MNAPQEIVPFTRLFPQTVRERIVRRLDRNDLLRYSLASKQFNADSNPIIWEEYTFWFEPHGSDFIERCESIRRNPVRALCIKSFTFMLRRTGNMYNPIPWPPAIFPIFFSALELLRSVTHFNLCDRASPQVAPIRTLAEGVLNSLCHCIGNFMQTTPIRSFSVRLDLVRAAQLLLLCPTIHVLRLHTSWQDDGVSVPFPWNALPALRDLEVDVHHVRLLAPDRPHLSRLSLSLHETDRDLGDVLRRCRLLHTFRVRQPPCPTGRMGERLTALGRMPTVQNLEYAFYEPEVGDCMARGTPINGMDLRQVLDPVREVFENLHSCLLDVAAHPEDTAFPALLRDGPSVLRRIQADGHFPFLHKFVWNMGPGIGVADGDRLVVFERLGGSWRGSAWFDV